MTFRAKAELYNGATGSKRFGHTTRLYAMLADNHVVIYEIQSRPLDKNRRYKMLNLPTAALDALIDAYQLLQRES